MTRIMMVLSARDWATAAQCIDSARRNAADTAALGFSLSLDTEPTEDDRREMEELGSSLFLVPGLTPWEDMELLWQGDGCVLAGHAAMRFSPNWDRELLRALRWCQKAVSQRSVLTGYLPRQIDPIDAVYPVAAERIDRRDQLHFRRGTPLRYAVHPVPSAFLHPAFCFAPAAFFRAVARRGGPTFLAAYAERWDIYTLHRPVIHMLADSDVPLVSLRGLEEHPGLDRFEARTGVHVAQRRLSPRAECGIITTDMSFESRVPMATRVQEALRDLDNRVTKIDPLCVTAWLTLPDVKLDEQRMIRFRRMCAMKNVQLVCYADTASAGKIALSFPQVQEYRRYYGLDVPSAAAREDLRNYIKLCKPFLLARAAQNSLRFSHYLWVDFDLLHYPAYERAALDWETICRDRVMMAVVDGRPDTSMIAVPQRLLEDVCGAFTQLIGEDLQKHLPLPEEKAFWVRLMHLHPDWFELVELPGRKELFTLTMAGRGEEFHTE